MPKLQENGYICKLFKYILMARLQKEQYLSDIIDKLTGLESNVELRGLVNLLDLHVISEDFYVGLLNLVYGWSLHNANESLQNTPGFDLVDTKNKILVQVTGSCTKKKIDHSLNGISNVYKDFHFYFAPIVNDAKKQKGYKYKAPHNIIFNPSDDILDIHSIVNKIKSETSIDKVEEIATFIQKNIRPSIPDPTLLDSGLEYIIIHLADSDFEESIIDTKEFAIEAKISFNNLSGSAKGLIEEYKAYYINVQRIYDAYADQGKAKSKAVMQKLHKIYLSLKLHKSGDDLFEAIGEEIINQINFERISDKLSKEELEMCVDILMVHAFMECKIFEKPL